MRRAIACVATGTGLVVGSVYLGAAPDRTARVRSLDALPAAAAERLAADVAAVQRFRPGYRFWRHVFSLPDGAIAYGSAETGRLIATFPARGDWTAGVVWQAPADARVLAGRAWPAELTRRRELTAELLASAFGPVLHNPTRGQLLLPNLPRYGAFVREWGAIYERFGVPADLGLAQALVESGLSGTVRSEAQAIGFCQWLPANWNRLKRLAPHVIEGHNQTTQASFCAAYLTVLAAKYGSFIPALSEHHTGGTNVGRVLINGERLGGGDVRERYFLGAEFARDLRVLAPGTYRAVYGTYGPRSYRYAEMVFGNAETVAVLAASTPQVRIFAMRTARPVTLADVARRAGLPVDEVRRYNQALVSRVPARATLYLPAHVPALGTDVAFWHRPPAPAYSAALADFLSLALPAERWDDPAFDPVLREFRRRFAATNTEEGHVMATTLAFVLEDRQTNRQAQILKEFRTSDGIRRLFEQAQLERLASRPSADTPRR